MNRSIVPAVKQFPPLTMPSQHVEVLPNGITLHYLSAGHQPVCRLSLLFAGGIAEIGNQLTPRLALASCTDASLHYPHEKLADILDFNGVRPGASAHSHFTSFNISMLNHRVNDVLPVMLDFLSSPEFPERQLQATCLAQKSQIATMRSDSSFIANEEFELAMNGSSHPLTQPIVADPIENFTPADAAALHRQLICPHRAHAFLSGLLSDSLIDDVRRTLGALPSLSDGYNIDIKPYTHPSKPFTKVVDFEHTYQSAIAAGMPAIDRSHPDYIDLRLTVMALGGYFGSRLMTNIREEKGLTYGISSALLGSQEGAYVKIGAQCDKSYSKLVLDEIRNELVNLAVNPPAGKELERLKLFATTSLAEILDTPTAIMGYYSTQILVGTPDDYFAAQQRAISALSSDKIAEMATKWLDPDNLSAIIVGE